MARHNAAIDSLGDGQVLILNCGKWPMADEPVWKMPLKRLEKTIDSSFIVAREYVTRLKRATVAVEDKVSLIVIGSTARKYVKPCITGLVLRRYLFQSSSGEAEHADHVLSKSDQPIPPRPSPIPLEVEIATPHSHDVRPRSVTQE